MDAIRRAGHRSRDRQVCGGGDATDHRPDERALTLVVHPGMEMVADPDPVDARLLGLARELDLLARAELFTGQEVSDFDVRHLALVPTAGTFVTHWMRDEGDFCA